MIVERLKGLRNNARMSQKDFAQALKVSQQTVASWEVGRTEPSNLFLIEIADYFNVTTDYLLGRDEESSLSDSDIQSILLDSFNKLDDEGKNIILSVVTRFLGVRSSSVSNSFNVKNSEKGRNYGVVGGNFSSNVTIG